MRGGAACGCGVGAAWARGESIDDLSAFKTKPRAASAEAGGSGYDDEVSLEASRYLEVARSHPDAGGLDVSSSDDAATLRYARMWFMFIRLQIGRGAERRG